MNKKKRYKKCPECFGSGFLGGDIWSKLPCATCDGGGKVKNKTAVVHNK